MCIAYALSYSSSMLLYSAKDIRTFENRLKKTSRKHLSSNQAAILEFLWEGWEKTRETSSRKAGGPTSVNNLETHVHNIRFTPGMASYKICIGPIAWWGSLRQREYLKGLVVDRDRLCGLVVRVSGYRYRGLGFDSRRYQIFWVVVGLERGPLSLVRSTEELLE